MLNKAIIMGRLTAEPELKHTQNNIAVLSFTVAVDRSFARDGKRETDFLDVVAWRSTAEFISKYFRKGQMIAISGSIQTRMWEDKDGKKRKSVEIVADEASFTGSKAESAASGREDYAPEPSDYDAPLPAAEGSDFQEVSEGDPELPF